ncbi:hypothetical protein GEMRC1_004718 [Eukaryota sp. GEM-RC1]
MGLLILRSLLCLVCCFIFTQDRPVFQKIFMGPSILKSLLFLFCFCYSTPYCTGSCCSCCITKTKLNLQSSQFLRDLTIDGDIESNPGPETAFVGIDLLGDETWLESSHLNFGHHLIAQKYPFAAEIIGDFDPMEFGRAIRNQDNLADVSATIKSKNVGKVLVVMPINDAITALFLGSHWGLAIYDLALSRLYFADSLNGKMFLNSTKEHVARASNLFILTI